VISLPISTLLLLLRCGWRKTRNAKRDEDKISNKKIHQGKQKLGLKMIESEINVKKFK